MFLPDLWSIARLYRDAACKYQCNLAAAARATHAMMAEALRAYE
jgi:hypothetical protein